MSSRRAASWALVAFVLAGVLVALPGAAAATVSGGCVITGTSTSGGSVDLTSTDVWHLRSTDEITLSGSAPSLQTQAAVNAYLVGLGLPVINGQGTGDTSASVSGIPVSTLAYLGRVFVIGGTSSGPEGGCSGQFTVVLDDVSPLLTVMGGGGAAASLLGLLGTLAAVRRPDRVRRLVLAMISLTLLLGGAALVLQQSWTPGQSGAPGRSAFAMSLVGPSGVTTDPSALAQAAGLSLLIVILMPFPSELFNRTLEENLDRIHAFLGRLPLVGGMLRAPDGEQERRAWWQPLAVALFVLISGLLYGLLDPSFGTDPDSGLLYLGLVVALLAVAWVSNLPLRAVHRTRDGDRGRLHAAMGTLVIAAGCVLISRAAGFLPGYLYGLILGYRFARGLEKTDEGRARALGGWWMLAVAAVCWVMLEAVRSPGIAGTLPGVIGENVLVALVVAGIEGVVFGFVPLRFLHGERVFQWRRGQWAALYAIGVFGFFWIILNPTNGFLPDGPTTSFATALALFAGFGLVSILFWGWFRLRPGVVAGE